jgi:hypothetical protein
MSAGDLVGQTHQARPGRLPDGVAAAQWLSFSLPLRGTSGTVWFEAVELHDCGRAVTVETY